MLYKFVVSTFESIVDMKLYSDFHAHLEKKLTRNGIGTRNPKAKPKVYSSHAEDLIVLLLFAVSFSALEQEY